MAGSKKIATNVAVNELDAMVDKIRVLFEGLDIERLVGLMEVAKASECPVCAARKAKHAERMKRWREKRK